MTNACPRCKGAKKLRGIDMVFDVCPVCSPIVSVVDKEIKDKVVESVTKAEIKPVVKSKRKAKEVTNDKKES